MSAAKLVKEQGYSISAAATSLGVDPGSIRGWLKNFATPESASAEGSLKVKLERLRKESKRLLMECEILKKATAFFAQEQP